LSILNQNDWGVLPTGGVLFFLDNHNATIFVSFNKEQGAEITLKR